MTLFDIMLIVLKTLRERALQFFATSLLLIILIWFFSGAASEYLMPVYHKPGDNENVCSSYFRCFLTYMNWGIRDNGPFDMPQNLPYTNPNYYGAFFFDWIFFFFIILILLNIVNAIIVDSFQNFREDATEAKNQKFNVCYICNLERTKFEMKGFNFEMHINKEHNLLNYIRYLIGLKIKNKMDLTSVQTSIVEKMDSNQIEFIPFEMAICLQDSS